MLLRWIVIRFKLLSIFFVAVLGITCGITGCDNKMPSAVDSPSTNPYGTLPFVSISSEELKRMIDEGDVFTLIDVRSTQEYLAGHIPGAISIPYLQLPYRYMELNSKLKTILYCRTEPTSFLAAQTLSRVGFTNLYILANGFLSWEYAVELNNGRKII
ncbi:MAG: rhodanese-like domain-containing protein [Desulfobacterales bacterium]|nr:rhodanese-like domain-containing protein [Desulfobacterales bacterium]